VRTAAVLPVKRLPLAKSRLGGTLGADDRRELALAMAGDVVAALAACPAIELIVLVSSEPAAAQIAAAAGAVVVDDGGGEPGQSHAVALGIARAESEGAERVLCVPGDTPALDPAELSALLAEAEAEVVIVPDRHGTGTNGLLLTPPAAIAPAFGPDSRARHSSLADQAGRSWQIAQPPSLTLDIDTGADLAELRARLAASAALAANTRRVLAGEGPP